MRQSCGRLTKFVDTYKQQHCYAYNHIAHLTWYSLSITTSVIIAYMWTRKQLIYVSFGDLKAVAQFVNVPEWWPL